MRFQSWILMTALIFICISAAEARNNGSSYDRQSGNCYQWNLNHDGSISFKRYNFRTGQYWNVNIEQDGSISGFGSNDNYWRYDAGNDTYVNYSAVILYEPWNGKLWTGRSYDRICN